MKKMTRFVLIVIMMITVVLSNPIEDVMAAEGNVIYSGDAGEFIFTPGSEHSLTDLFPEFKDVMPGDTLTQKIVVKNNAKKSVKISMRALGAHDDSKDFLSKLNLYVEKVTDTPLFEAPADQTAQLTEWRQVGVLAAGGEAELQVGLQVPTSLDNNYKKLVGYIDWEFMVEEIDDTSAQTGDTSHGWMWLAGLGGSAVLVIIVLIVRKSKEVDKTETE